VKTEYICVVTMDERDVKLSAANGGIAIEHPPGASPVKTIFKLTNEVRDQLLRAATATEPSA
jgi:hypothetical protein